MNRNQEYWMEPDGHNGLAFYLADISGKKGLLLKAMEGIPKNASILEIGCNIGRNLNVLHEAGYKNLSGIDINAEAIAQSKQFFPKLVAKLKAGAIEDLIPTLPKYDVIYSLAVFEHIHTDSDWIFPEIEQRVNKRLITIEDEKNSTWKHFPRNYRTFFPNLKHVSVSEPISGGELDGFLVRIFEHE